MQKPNVRALSCLVLALGACSPGFDPNTPLPVGPTDAGDDGEASASTNDDSDEGDEGSDDSIPGPSSGGDPPPPTDPEPTCESDIGEPCAEHGDCCDSESGDALCVSDGVNTICHQTCTSNSECGSGCCGETNSGDGVCLPEVYCTGICFADPGEECTQNDDCCGYAEGTASCVNFPEEGAYCSATCIWGSDCNSGCCVPLDNGLGACAPDYYCAGAPEEPETEPDEATSQAEPNASYERAVSL